jgi:hypothetical protein
MFIYQRTVIVFVGIHCLAMSKDNFVNSSTMSSTSLKKAYHFIPVNFVHFVINKLVDLMTSLILEML